nr:RHS domain-containing protein [Pseudescherichia vulneris]
MNAPDMYWFHNQPNGMPERLTDAEGRVAATPYPA